MRQITHHMLKIIVKPSSNFPEGPHVYAWTKDNVAAMKMLKPGVKVWSGDIKYFDKWE